MKIKIHPEFGYHYYEPPEQAELDKHYREKYFQASDIYVRDYDEREREFFLESARRKIELVLASRGLDDLSGLEVLEIGVGEGWCLAALSEFKATVTGVDYTSGPCRHHNPQVVGCLQESRPEEKIQELLDSGKTFDIVWLDNVFEHVPDPAQLLRSLKSILKNSGQLMIEIPNDFSPIQRYAFEEKMISREFWLAYPEHLTYFSADSLEKLLGSEGFETQDVIADFPIDLFLLHDRANYIEDPTVGKATHHARVRAEELISKQPRKSVVAFYRAMATIGLGRNVINLSRKRH